MKIPLWKTWEGLKLKDFLGSRMSPVVIDLMAPSDTLAKLFSKSSSDSLLGKVPFLKNKDDENEERKRKPSLGLAIALEDRRTKKQVQRDNNLNIEQIKGDLMQASVWRSIADRLQGKKADLILERAAGGVELMPVNKKYYAIVLQKIWQMLNENGGMILLETPSVKMLESRNIPIKEWIEKLKASGVDASYIPSEPKTFMRTSGSLKIIRRPNSPQQLPFLS